MKRTVDVTKKSNIKCEHCEHWGEEYQGFIDYLRICNKSGQPKHYYQRCKQFVWRKDILMSNRKG